MNIVSVEVVVAVRRTNKTWQQAELSCFQLLPVKASRSCVLDSCLFGKK